MKYLFFILTFLIGVCAVPVSQHGTIEITFSDAEVWCGKEIK